MYKKSMHKGLSLKPLFLKTILLSIAIISVLALASCDDGGGNGSNDDGGGNNPEPVTCPDGSSKDKEADCPTQKVFSLTYVDSVDDADSVAVGGHSYELDGASSVSTAIIAGTTYLFVTGEIDDGVSVFSVADDGTLTHVTSVDDADQITAGNPPYELDGARSVSTAVIGDTTYLFVVGEIDDGVSVFSVAADGTLTHVTSVDDADPVAAGDPPYELNGARSVSTAEIGANTYLFVASEIDDGVSVFSVAADGTLTHVTSVDDADPITDDDPPYELNGASSVDTAVIGGTTYLFVAGLSDNGVSVFSVTADGTLTHTDSVDATDSDAYRLIRLTSVSTAMIDGITYLFVTEIASLGITVFSVNANGTLTHAGTKNNNDDATGRIDGPQSTTAAVVGTTTYLFVGDLRFIIFSVASDGKLTYVDSKKNGDDVDDGLNAGTYKFAQVRSLSIAVIGGITYLFVPGHADDAITVFKVEESWE